MGLRQTFLACAAGTVHFAPRALQHQSSNFFKPLSADQRFAGEKNSAVRLFTSAAFRDVEGHCGVVAVFA